jgi:hypothetical protein
MGINKLKISQLLILLVFCTTLNGQTMYVRPITGAQSGYAIATIQKLTFSNGYLSVTNNTGDIGTFALSENRYINFVDLSLGTTIPEWRPDKFFVYPNPTTTLLNVATDSTSATLLHLKIISIAGSVLLEQSSPQIDITSLPQGIYFCRITTSTNSQIIKFLKQ